MFFFSHHISCLFVWYITIVIIIQSWWFQMHFAPRAWLLLNLIFFFFGGKSKGYRLESRPVTGTDPDFHLKRLWWIVRGTIIIKINEEFRECTPCWIDSIAAVCEKNHESFFVFFVKVQQTITQCSECLLTKEKAKGIRFVRLNRQSHLVEEAQGDAE